MNDRKEIDLHHTSGRAFRLHRWLFLHPAGLYGWIQGVCVAVICPGATGYRASRGAIGTKRISKTHRTPSLLFNASHQLVCPPAGESLGKWAVHRTGHPTTSLLLLISID